MAEMFTVAELARLYGTDPKNLPPLYVHPDRVWKEGVIVDSKGRMHMAEWQFRQYVKPNLPTKFIARAGYGTELHHINLEAYHLVEASGARTSGVQLSPVEKSSIHRRAKQAKRNRKMLH